MSTHALRWAAFVVLFMYGDAFAQTQVNPDISAIGDMRYIFRDNVARGLAESNSTSFEFEELELNFAGYLNPYARADVFIAIHGVTGPVEIEEAYGSVLRGIPIQLRFGKYFSNFSRLLSQHPHQYAWLERPLMHTTVFGPDGAPLIGARASKLIGIGDAALTLSGDAFRSDFFELEGEEEEHAEEEEGEHAHGGEGGKYEVGYMARASLFNELTDATWLDVGGSFMWAEYDPEHKLTTNVYGVDAKLKWRPDSYKGARVLAELQFSDREVETDTLGTIENVNSIGAFAAGEFKFRRRYDTGAFFDFVQDPADKDLSTQGFGAWFAFMPSEETIRFNLVYRNEWSDFYEGNAQSITFQVLFGLGPHKAHQF